MIMEGPIDQFVTRTPEAKMNRRRRGVDIMLNRLALQQPVGLKHLQIMLCSTSEWPILDLPVELMRHIISFLDLEDGTTVSNLSKVSRFFRELIGRPKVIRRTIPRAKGLNPETIYIDLSNPHVHNIPSCDTLILYASDTDMSEWINAPFIMERVGRIYVEAHKSNGPIMFLYTLLDRMKDKADMIIVRTTYDYRGLLDKPSEYFTSHDDGTYEIRIPYSVSRHKRMYPAKDFVRYLYRLKH